MSKTSIAILRLLGAFTVEVNAAGSVSVAVRSKKARALLAYLAMKPDGRASREELATLLWGDTPDAQARHSLRQCLVSLRQDTHHLAPDLLLVGRETIELRANGLAVDAREFISLATSSDPDGLGRAAKLWRGAFLADLALDIEEFDAWRAREQDRLADAAARVFERLCASADVAGNGECAIAAAERLVALDPTREDRQRVALKILARHRGRDAALDRARQLTNLLRSELAVSPGAATRALVDDIRNGAVGPATQSSPPLAPETAAMDGGSEAALVSTTAIIASAPAAAPADEPTGIVAIPALAVHRHRWRAPAVLAAIGAIAIGGAAAFWLATGPAQTLVAAKPSTRPGLASAVVLPFSVEGPRDAQDQAFAQLLAHDLTAHLARYDLRMISHRTADLYRDRADVAKIGAELGVPYAIVGRVQRSAGGVRAEVQLIEAATRVTLWSDQVQREPGEPATLADEVARGFARPVLINIASAEARRLRRDPDRPVEVSDLLLRARVVEMRGHLRENVSQALRLYEEALQRAPQNLAAMHGVARMTLTSAMNFIDLDTPPSIPRAEKLLNEVLARSPNSAPAHFTLGLLQKYRRQFEASLQSFQRSLELNPSFLPARAQMGVVLSRMGQPQKGLDLIQETMRLATPNDPSMGFWCLFAGEVELELGHEEAALQWMLRANMLMPRAPLVQAWLAGVYTVMGDGPNAAKYVAELKKMAPGVTQRFVARASEPVRPNAGYSSRLLQGLRLALAG